MKKILLFALMITAVCGTMTAQTKVNSVNTEKMNKPVEKNENGPIMSLESNTVDYGTIKQHGEPLRTVKFTNTGKEPLIIKNARGSCGCTVPTWPKEPIMPGQTEEIEIRYATNRLGKINKKVTITTNEGGDPHVIKVVGNILKPEQDETVPTSEPNILKGGDN